MELLHNITVVRVPEYGPSVKSHTVKGFCLDALSLAQNLLIPFHGLLRRPNKIKENVMKLSKIKLLALVVSVLLLGFGIVSSIGADAPGEKEFPGEKLRVFTIADWLNALDRETQDQVVSIFEHNLECAENGDNESLPEGLSWKEAMYDALQDVVTPEQLKGFIYLMDGNYQGDRISFTTSDCSDCDSPFNKLGSAQTSLSSALGIYAVQRYNYCDFPFTDKVYIYLGMASSNATNAWNAANTAKNSCDCTSAQQALSYANAALGHLNTAISNTATYCEPDSPWINHMYVARNWLTQAITALPACVSEACD